MENTKKIQEMLMNAIFEVFEKMFFVFLEPFNENVKYDMVSAVNFKGPMTGEIKIFFASGLIEAMVQNMLSVSKEELTEKMIEDCAKEAANMIGGNFLHNLDSSKVFGLSIPMFTKNSGVFVPQVKDQSEASWALSFESEGNYLAVSANISAGGM